MFSVAGKTFSWAAREARDLVGAVRIEHGPAAVLPAKHSVVVAQRVDRTHLPGEPRVALQDAVPAREKRGTVVGLAVADGEAVVSAAVVFAMEPKRRQRTAVHAGPTPTIDRSGPRVRWYFARMTTSWTSTMLRAALSLCAVALLPACGVGRSLNGGLFAVPTGGDHDLVGGIVSGQYAYGNRLYAGVDATVRATGDYAHGALGTHVSFISQRSPVGPYARLGFAPLAASLRDRTVWYALNTSLELGVEIPFGPRTHTVHGLFQTTDQGSAWTVGVRGDVEYRPAQDQADVFVSLVFGYHDYDIQ